MALPHGSGVTNTPLRTHPASYRGGVVPTGSTRQSVVTAVTPRFPMALNVENPARNQAEVGTPRSSEYGAQLHAIIRGGHVIRNEAPVLPQTTGGFRGFVGNFLARAAKSVIIPRGAMYAGQLPLSQQPKVDKPYPWMVGPPGTRYAG